MRKQVANADMRGQVAQKPLCLPRKNGRGPRVAMLVYNDAHNDARVLKEAASLRQAGATVKVFAVSRASSGYAAGEARLPGDIPVYRGNEFSLATQAPRLLQCARVLTGRNKMRNKIDAPASPAPDVLPTVASPDAPAPKTELAQQMPLPPVLAPTSGAAKNLWHSWEKQAKTLATRLGHDAWMRTYRVAGLSLYWLETARAVLAWKPDVVHANDANTLAPALWVKRRSGAKLIYDSHELWLRRNLSAKRPLAPYVEAAIEREGIAHSDGIITVSPSIAAWLQARYHLANPPALVRNIPSAEVKVCPGQGRLHELAGLDPSVRIIAYGGRITTARGIEQTLAALALLPADIHFVMLGYGDASYLQSLQKLAQKLGVAARVHRVGPVEAGQVAPALADGDVCVVYVQPTCLSYRFALPNKLFEAIHATVPVVAADLPDLAALVREWGVGAVFTADSTSADLPAALAQTIAAVLADPQPYREAARVAAQALTWQHEARTLIHVYRRALLGSRA